MDVKTKSNDQDKYTKYPAGQNAGNGIHSGGDCACTGCSSNVDDVRLLPCLHVVCMTCVSDAVDRSKRAGKTTLLYSCPQCNHKVNIAALDQINSVLRDVPNFLKHTPLPLKPNCNMASHNVTNTEKNIVDSNTVLVNDGDMENQTCGDRIIESGGIDSRCEGNGSDDNDTMNGYVAATLHTNCDECGQSMLHKQLQHCSACTKTVCSGCQTEHHTDHSMVSILDYIQNKIDYIQSLVEDIHQKILKHREGLACVCRVRKYLGRLKESIKADVIQRADCLISLVNQRKQSMLKELEDSFQTQMVHYDKTETLLSTDLEHFGFVEDFSRRLVEDGCDLDILQLHNEVTSQCLHQIHQVPDAAVDIVSMQLDVPGRGKEQAALEKLFGTLKEGTVLSGSAQLVASFNVDLKWPTSITVSPGKEVVVAGKTGAFDSEGRALFFDGRGRFHSKLTFDKSRVPIDVESAGDGTVWLSTSSGELQNVTVAGRVLRTVSEAFHGSGRLGALTDNCLVVSCSGKHEIRLLDELGQLVRSIVVPGTHKHDAGGESRSSSKISCLTTNSSDLVLIGNTDHSQIAGLDLNGQEIFTYSGTEDTPALKCPSALCCDPFDNILVADFTSDSVHLLSKDGMFLCCLLDADNGLSCPNCLALDTEGHLYVGQYGGDIRIYSYMSCAKKV